MFETSVMAEYLRRTPEELDDYIEYGHVLDFKRIKLFPEAVSAEKAREIEGEYTRVKPLSENKNGKVRNHWNKHPISYMAEKVERGQQYEIPYSIAASIRHGNFITCPNAKLLIRLACSRVLVSSFRRCSALNVPLLFPIPLGL
jgi:hypothetical protein